MRCCKWVLIALCMLTSVFAQAVVLVQEGEPRATVLIPDEAGPTVAFAAAELARYVELMSDAALPIVEEGQAPEGTPVHVGATSAAQGLIPTDPESILIRAEEDRLILCGGSDRGTLFAVYRFLEDALGCRWLTPDQEYVPRSATVAVAPMERAFAPEFNMRTFIAGREDRRAWGIKMGMNGFYSREEVEQTGGAYYLPVDAPGCHTYYRIIPSEEHFATHPEWFPLLGGERRPGQLHNAQLCVTAPGLADEFARRVIELFDEDPHLQVMSVSPNDGYGWCECEACMALDERLCGSRTTRQGLAGERPFVGDRVFWFANEVAGRVAQVHPDKLLLVLAYVNYAEPPDTIEPAPNVVPWLCHYAPADYSRPINDPTSEPNAQFNALLERWADRAPHLLFYSYVSKSMWWRLPRPVTASFAADVKHLHALGIRRYYCQSALSDWALDGPLYYVVAKLLWDPQADPEAVAADWIAHMFGPAAEPMTRFYSAVEDSIRASGKAFSDNPPRDVPGLYDLADLDRALRCLDEARELADDETIAGRVERVATVFDYGRHMVRALEAAAEFRTEPTVERLREIREHGEAALSSANVAEARRFLDRFRMTEELGVVGQGFSEPLELGGRRCWNSDETGPGDGRAGWATITIPTPDATRPVRLEMDVWGTSELAQVVVNTDGEQKSYAQGGIWTPVRPRDPLSGQEQWDTLVFIIPPEAMAPGKRVQVVGMGGGDSQIWVAHVRVSQAEE